MREALKINKLLSNYFNLVKINNLRSAEENKVFKKGDLRKLYYTLFSN